MKTMKKTCILLCLALAAALFAACAPKAKTEIIGVTLPSTSTTLNARIGELVTAKFEGKKVQVQSADNDVSTQIAHINGFITMGAKMIVVVPTELEALEEPLAKARAAGIKVVISGASSGISAFDAVTKSNEYLVGQYVALLAKHWAEDTLSGKEFDTLILCSDLNDDAILRSDGMKSLTAPFLTDGTTPNPAYSELVAGGNVIIGTMGLSSTGNEMISTYLTQYPNIKLVLAYMSGFSPTMSQYIVDGNYDDEQFAIFSGGVQGNESDYLIGSLDPTSGTRSIFRGAVSFGGADAAQGVADLAYKVYTGTEGVDYQRETTETIGVWYTYTPERVLACFTVSEDTFEDFDPQAMLTSPKTEIKWKAG